MKIIALAAGLLAASVATSSAQSGVTPDCTPAWGRYSAAPGPKAFANGAARGCGWQIKNDTYATAAAIRAKALQQCAEQAGSKGGCRIVNEAK
jgi:hypothetical protein